MVRGCWGVLIYGKGVLELFNVQLIKIKLTQECLVRMFLSTMCMG